MPTARKEKKKNLPQTFCFSQQKMKTYFTGFRIHLLEAQSLGSVFILVELGILRLGLNLQVEGVPAREMPLPNTNPQKRAESSWPPHPHCPGRKFLGAHH